LIVADDDENFNKQIINDLLKHGIILVYEDIKKKIEEYNAYQIVDCSYQSMNK